MNWPTQERWEKLWRSAAATGDSRPWYQQLSNLYREPHRTYHNFEHIAECLSEFDQTRHLAIQPGSVEFALWFHDAVYDPKASDNEEKSAEMAKRCLEDAGLRTIAATVADLVMATKRHDVGTNRDAALVVDIDLSILGKEPNRFEQYETQIRGEYSWVPEPVFNSRRAEILQTFLARPQIYTNQDFVTRYERRARENLARSIQRLKRT